MLRLTEPRSGVAAAAPPAPRRPATDALTESFAPQHREKLLCDNVANARLGSTMARVLPVRFQIVTIIESDLLSRSDVALGHNPNPAVEQPRLE